MHTLTELIKGEKFIIYALSTDASAPYFDFMNYWEQQIPSEHLKMLSLLELSSNNGPPRNYQKSSEVYLRNARPGEKLYEFKTTKLRIFYFYDKGGMIICTNGIHKKDEKKQIHFIDIAHDLMRQYFTAKATQKIKIVPLGN